MHVRSIVPLAGTLAVALLAGCAGTSSTPGTSPSLPQAQSQSHQTPLTVGFSEHGFVQNAKAKTFTVGVRLEGEKSDMDATYGKILGYFKGVKSKKTHVITIKTGEQVVFMNVDPALEHTGSFLGDASAGGANWPSTFTGSSTASPAGTDISTANFSTGAMSHGSSSATYAANVPGFYMFGCAFHYQSSGMRDIIIVQ